MSKPTHHVAILGCGVIGLSTALAILEDQSTKPCRTRTSVTIVSKEVPDFGDGTTSTHSAEYASIWAGGHHVSDAKTERELRHDKLTFERMSRLVSERPWSKSTSQQEAYGASPVVPIGSVRSTGKQYIDIEPLVWVHQTELFETAGGSSSTLKAPYEGVLNWYPDFKRIPASKLKPSIGHGCTFSTININVPLYHSWLVRHFIELGGRLVVAEAKSLSEAIQLATCPPSTASIICRYSSHWTNIRNVDILVASPGLGARTIQGINDHAVHPQRGQVVVINAPWLSTSSTLPSYAYKPKHEIPGFSIVRAQGGREVYIIPRGDGTVVCGGTRIFDDWDPKPRSETTRKILKRCLELVPQLVNPKKRTGLTKPKVQDLEVVGVNVGLRPARRGGVRLERGSDVEGVKIVHSYGYGGAGYQASWGAALDAKQLVEQALQSSSPFSSRSARL
ncbi:related to D-amino acid oxidase [Melanopsichium pennsylvanicum]|uniref:Related to D-amino acid oxidase n=2 Tax=Melanopsichium pennsylvanicum TaxID=63383 RepID=A0AAJ4XI49_9BASI|nr:related to D-amino acid oxidase [Melanopsichium pennsylvanicum 4]SNX82540.1 related to D-amino acid oxidase [Melanopsichium pennsylvanicum]